MKRISRATPAATDQVDRRSEQQHDELRTSRGENQRADHQQQSALRQSAHHPGGERRGEAAADQPPSVIAPKSKPNTVTKAIVIAVVTKNSAAFTLPTVAQRIALCWQPLINAGETPQIVVILHLKVLRIREDSPCFPEDDNTMRRRSVWVRVLTGLCAPLVLVLPGCYRTNFVKSYDEGISAQQPLRIGERSFVVDTEGWCSTVRMTTPDGSRSWSTGLHSGKFIYPRCREARFSQDGRYLLVPLVGPKSSDDRILMGEITQLVVVDLRLERELTRIWLAD